MPEFFQKNFPDLCRSGSIFWRYGQIFDGFEITLVFIGIVKKFFEISETVCSPSDSYESIAKKIENRSGTLTTIFLQARNLKLSIDFRNFFAIDS